MSFALQKDQRVEAGREIPGVSDAEARKIETPKDELIQGSEARLATRETIDR